MKETLLKSVLSIAENISLDFDLSITNGLGKTRSVMDVNLTCLDLTMAEFLMN